MASEPNASKVGSRRPLRRLWPLYLLLSIIVLAAFLTGGRGGLGLFNPHTLQYRTQREFTIWFGAIPVYRSAFDDHERPLVRELIQREFIAPTTNRDRWDYVFHWNDAWKDGYGVWYDTLVRNDDQLLEWTKANPEMAKTFWSEAFDYMRSDSKVDQAIGERVLHEGWRVSDEASLRTRIAETKRGIEELYGASSTR